jgi:hypothetical protein
MLKEYLKENVDQPEEVTGTQDLNKGGHSHLGEIRETKFQVRKFKP